MKTYYQLTKPRIIFGNLITTTGSFAFASRNGMDYWLLMATLTGISLIIAGACVFNNYIDRVSDSKMLRTQNRAFPQGEITEKKALLFGSALALLGGCTLFLYSGILAALLAALGFIVYVFFYSLLKYHTRHATLIGSLAGALPPVAGYCAVSAHLDRMAILLLVVMILWQMPHFFAIALHRLEDYRAAHMPVLPVAKGIGRTRTNIIWYTVAFMAAAPLLPLLGNRSYVALAVITLLGLSWTLLALQKGKPKWARTMFSHSLIVIMALFATLAFL